MRSVITVLLLLATMGLQSQVSINSNGTDPDGSAMLDVQSTEKGMLVPRMTAAQRDAIGNPATGLLVFVNTDSSFYYYNGTNWLPVSMDSQVLEISGNTLTLSNGGSVDLSTLSYNMITDEDNDSKIQVEESEDEDVIRFDVQGDEAMTIKKNFKNVAEQTVNTLGSQTPVIQAGSSSNVLSWQSFKATATGAVEAIQLYILSSSPVPSYEITIRRGQGLGGTLLATTSVTPPANSGWVTIPIPGNIVLNQGVTYSIVLNTSWYLGARNGNPYPDGMLSWNTDFDLALRVFTFNEFTQANIIGQLAINQSYSFPTEGGTNGQILVTDGNGDLSWSDNIVNQTLSLNSNTLSLSNGGSVDLSTVTHDVITDQDNDTRILVEESPDEDVIRFDVNGIEVGKVDELAKWDFMGPNDVLTIGGGNNGTGGESNTFIGNGAALPHTSGNLNTAIGKGAMGNDQSGNNNTVLGAFALFDNISGKNNTMVGASAGQKTLGDGNVFLGYGAGNNETGSNKLYINNNATSAPLLYGEFDDSFLKVNGSTEVTSQLHAGTSLTSGQSSLLVGRNGGPNIEADGSGNNWLIADGNVANNGRAALNYYSSGNVILANGGGRVGVGETGPDTRLHVKDNVSNSFVATIENTNNSANANGLLVKAGENFRTVNNTLISFQRPDGIPIGSIVQNTSTSVAYNTISDQRLKTGFQPTQYGLENLLRIEVKDYNYIDDPDQTESGFIAQQLYEHYPIAVVPGGDDPKSDPWTVSYGRVTPLLVKSVQEQQEQIEELKAENASITAENDRIRAILDEMDHLKAELETIKKLLKDQ